MKTKMESAVWTPPRFIWIFGPKNIWTLGRRYLYGRCRDICMVKAEIFARQMPRYLHNVTRKTKVHFWQYYSGCWTPPALLSKHSSPIIIHGNVFIWYPEGGKCIFLYKVFRFWIVPEISLYRYTGECGGKRLHKKFQEYCVNVYTVYTIQA